MPTVANMEQLDALMRTRVPKFFEELAKSGNVSAACRASKLDHSTAYRYRREEPDFAAQWAQALDVAADGLEQVAYNRAVVGFAEPVIYKGEVMMRECDLTGEVVPLVVHKPDNTVLMRLLEAAKPEKYRRHAEVQINMGDELVKLLAAGRARVGKR